MYETDINIEIDPTVTWCEHIHNWGDAFYYVDVRDPFAVIAPNNYTRVWKNHEWKLCPICQKPAPKLKLRKRPNNN